MGILIPNSVFPTCVGMNRGITFRLSVIHCVPHMRGDEPVTAVNYYTGESCSPHAWG